MYPLGTRILSLNEILPVKKRTHLHAKKERKKNIVNKSHIKNANLELVLVRSNLVSILKRLRMGWHSL